MAVSVGIIIVVGLYLTVSISITSANPNIDSMNSNSTRLKSFDQLFEARREPRTYREGYKKAATSDAKAQQKNRAHIYAIEENGRENEKKDELAINEIDPGRVVQKSTHFAREVGNSMVAKKKPKKKKPAKKTLTSPAKKKQKKKRVLPISPDSYELTTVKKKEMKKTEAKPVNWLKLKSKCKATKPLYGRVPGNKFLTPKCLPDPIEKRSSTKQLPAHLFTRTTTVSSTSAIKKGDALVKVYTLPIGQGDCNIIECNGGKNVIIFDCGSSGAYDINEFFYWLPSLWC